MDRLWFAEIFLMLIDNCETERKKLLFTVEGTIKMLTIDFAFSLTSVFNIRKS